MGEFFGPWKSRIGMFTLALACILMVGWVRSLSIKDEISLRTNPAVTHHFISNRCRLAWKTVTVDDPVSIRFTTRFYFSTPAREELFYRGPRVDWIWRREFLGSEFGRFTPDGPPWEEEIWIIPYWSAVVPLTLISVWFFISKSRRSKSKSSDEPM